MAQSSLIFVSGGVRSGKSSFAEKLAITQAKKRSGTLFYIACGRSGDAEMNERIARHQNDRKSSPKAWMTLEYPVAIERAIPRLDSSSIVLLDCLTTLLNNEMFPYTKNMDEWKSPTFLASVKRKIIEGITEIREHASCLIIVSNEVLHDPIIDNGVNNAYSKMIGSLHQEIVLYSDKAYVMEAGCAVLMKGETE
ncbi:bifunctional adenosylcobinamide kinase/adenosylcobinamide-phosphate guanylyltransferase [Peribacillus cavernae]|uniref:Adenosylcobinamide kinase n=1 Tax=Peribacillus cavernae TaxID=1674310 RepID=A0A433HTC7_9BACI|nr:bifunctional adenosylcobinamide kinase/adenosylcobinamide-phosphate guanylyltransferase [Peribacillus cavernae]MDQ0218592.1 adenosylcobinamide kinase/adenosylcobinamide-phosphate guanylyltransferase [Peribacillus cavernae]RUQ31579.1 bifunctional adenosylcobinamide kinase/adenosylcobinamide-phosphate guanylyltransferase [Peribacillus cavernae]